MLLWYGLLLLFKFNIDITILRVHSKDELKETFEEKNTETLNEKQQNFL